MFNFKRLFQLNRDSVRDLLTLLIYLTFSIIIIVDIIAFFKDKDLDFLIILTLLSGSLVAYSQAWYYGRGENVLPKELIATKSNIKPEVRIANDPMTQEELDESVSKEMEEK